MWNNVLSRLPDNYSREGQINNKKLHQVIYAEYEEIKNVFKDIKTSRDIDQAYGKTLELIGGNVQQPRVVGENDELYRLMIKTKIIANLSQGDIETINEIGKAVLGDSFVSVRETWNDPAYNREPAGLVFTLQSRARIIPNTIERAVAGGVGTYWVLILHEEGVYATATALMSEQTTIKPKIKTNLSSRANLHYSTILTSTDKITLRPYIKTKLEGEARSYSASTISSSDSTALYPHISSSIEVQSNIRTAMSKNETETITIYPKE